MNIRTPAFLAALLITPTAFAQQAGDPAAGEMVFTDQCSKCHAVGPDAQNGQGPVLNGLIGRRAGSYPNFNYSPQNRNFRVNWDAATLTRYLKAPKSYIPGTKMFFDGLGMPKDIADVIAYLGQFGADGNKKP